MNDSTIDSTPNPYKEVSVLIGGKGRIRTIFQVFGGDSTWTNYFAPGIRLFLGGDKGVSFRVTAKYVNVLEQMMKKFKDSQIGKAIGIIQKMADFAAGVDVKAIAEGIKGGKNKASDVLSGIKALPANVRYQTKLQNLPAWESTGPVELGSFVFRFYLGMAGKWDGRTEVYNPALAFMKINQPSELSSGMLQGPMPNTAWVYGVIGKSLAAAITSQVIYEGANIVEKAAKLTSDPEPKTFDKNVDGTYKWANAGYPGVEPGSTDPNFTQEHDDWAATNTKLKQGGKVPEDFAGQLTSTLESAMNNIMGKFEQDLSDVIDLWPGAGLVQIQIGQIALPKMTVENTAVEFSYDTDDKGYPIWAEVTWSNCKTLEVATVQQMPLRSASSDDGTTKAIGDNVANDGKTFKSIINGTLPPVKEITSAEKSAASGGSGISSTGASTLQQAEADRLAEQQFQAFRGNSGGGGVGLEHCLHNIITSFLAHCDMAVVLWVACDCCGQISTIPLLYSNPYTMSSFRVK